MLFNNDISIVKHNLVKLPVIKDFPILRKDEVDDGYQNYINASFMNVN